jgi:bromodomain-containing factor 1
LQNTMISTIATSISQHKRKMAESESTRKKAPAKPKTSKPKKAAGGGGGGGGKKAAAGAGGGAKKPKKAAKKIMGTLEKEIIAASINDLDASDMGKAIEIIKADTSQHVSVFSSPADVKRRPLGLCCLRCIDWTQLG